MGGEDVVEGVAAEPVEMVEERADLFKPEEEEEEEERKGVDGEDEEQESEEGRALVQISFPEERPEGVVPMMISMKNMEKYALKNGPGIKDTVTFKWFNKEQVMEEIRAVGFYSDFNEFKKVITAFPGEELLVLADPQEVYGQNFMLCVTEAARDFMAALVEEETAKFEALQREREEAEAARVAAEEAKRNVVYKEKPMVPRDMEDTESSRATVHEIQWLNALSSRRLVTLSISRKRSEFGAPIKLSDRESEQSGMFEFRAHKDPNFELRRRELSVGLQACPSWTMAWLPISPWAQRKATETHEEEDCETFLKVTAATAGAGAKKNTAGLFEFLSDNVTEDDLLQLREVARVAEADTQTSVFRQHNRAVQYEYIDMKREDRESEQEEARVGRFLAKVMGDLEIALQQNETLNVFADEFVRLHSEEVSGLGNKEDNNLRELRTFTDLVYSNGKVLSAVDWHPRLPNVVAVACSDPAKFDQRVESSGKEKPAFILIWNFADLIHPQLVLRSPAECTLFSFNPDQPNLIAGGCVTGQVVVWDISKAMAQLRRLKDGVGAEKRDGDSQPEDGQHGESAKENSSDNTAASATLEEDEKTSTIPPVDPLVISVIDQSHRRPVSHLEWVPHGLSVSAQGKVKALQNAGATASAVGNQGRPESANNGGKADKQGQAHQLVTCAGDGRVMFWETRFGTGKKQRQSGAAESTDDGSAAPEGTASEEIQWTPLFKFTLMRNEGSSEFSLSKVAFRGRLDQVYENFLGKDSSDGGSSRSVEASLKRIAIPCPAPSLFSCTTEEGEMLFGDWQGVRQLGSPRQASLEAEENAAETASDRAPETDAAAGSTDPDTFRVFDDKLHFVSTDHFRNSLALRRSPFFPYLLLSVAPNGFNIWKEDLNHPLFVSPIYTGMCALTCADWSPTRPGVVVLGKADGTVDIWDLVDQSHRPSATVGVAAYAITSIQFRMELKPNGEAGSGGHSQPRRASVRRSSAALHSQSKSLTLVQQERAFREAEVQAAVSSRPLGDKPQMIALGDATGNLHILEIPRNLRWRAPNEDKIVMAFFERELERAAYTKRRFKIRQEERDQAIATAAGVGSAASSLQIAQALAENAGVEKEPKEYKRLVEDEEKRYQALSARLLSEDLLASKNPR